MCHDIFILISEALLSPKTDVERVLLGCYPYARKLFKALHETEFHSIIFIARSFGADTFTRMRGDGTN